MDLIAVAKVMENKELKGIQLYDFNKMIDITMNIEQITKLLNRGIRISNIKIIDNTIKWSSGSINRYKAVGDEKDYLVLIGYYINKQGEKVYILYKDKGIIVLSHSDMITECLNNRVSNCKAVKNGNYIYPSMIGGKAQCLNLVSPRFYSNRGVLHINMYYNQSRVLDIPNKDWKGSNLSNISSIVTHNCDKDLIEHIKIPNSYKAIKAKYLKQFSNLKVIEYSGPGIKIDENTFNDININKIIINKLFNHCTNRLFKGGYNIEHIEYRDKPIVLEDSMYDGCVNLEPTDILYPGVSVIGINSFKKCNKLVDINLPSSLKLVSTTAFRDCDNIKTITFESTVVNLRIDDNKEMFSGGVKIYVPHSFSDKRLNDIISDDCEIIKNKQSEIERSIENRIVKAKVLGLEVNTDSPATSLNEVKAHLNVLTDDEWRTSLNDCIRVPGIFGVSYELMSGIANILIKVAFQDIMADNEIIGYYAGKKYTIVYGRSLLTVYLTDRINTLKHIDKLENKANFNYKQDDMDNDFVLSIPSRQELIKGGSIRNAYEDTDTIYIDIEGMGEIEFKF